MGYIPRVLNIYFEERFVRECVIFVKHRYKIFGTGWFRSSDHKRTLSCCFLAMKQTVVLHG